MKIVCKTLDDYASAAEKLINSFAEERVFAFFGEMGAGKTTFIKAICNHLGASNNAKSPSFAIINEYAVSNQQSNSIFHFDFYRINKTEEAYDIGYEEYFYSGNYCFVEWPEKITELLPENYVKVDITINDNNSRTINATEIS